MNEAPTPIGLTRPNALLLSRIDERLSFLYLDRCAIRQDDNGTVAAVETEAGPQTTQLPVATLTALLLGPGTSLTQQAMAVMSRAGCAVSFVGAGAVRSYGTFLSPYAPTDRLLQQAATVTNPQRRLAAAQRMYGKRFPGTTSATFADATIERLRGIEGIRMRALYAQHAKKARLRNWKRDTGTTGSTPDTINTALNSANSALYGVVNAIVLALGMSPGLGIIHTGNRQSFTLDIADLYKADITIPLAFSLKDETDVSSLALRRLREHLHLIKLIPRIVGDIDNILDLSTPPAAAEEDWDIDSLRLWDPHGDVPGNWSHATWIEP